MDVTRQVVGSVIGPCRRCGGATGVTTSYFNVDWICAACETREREHPAFAAAQAAEEAAVAAGNYNFVGVGCPAELYLPEGRA